MPRGTARGEQNDFAHRWWERGSTDSVSTVKDRVTPAKFKPLTPSIILMTTLRESTQIRKLRLLEVRSFAHHHMTSKLLKQAFKSRSD